jgi:hypothetical protein
VKSAVKQRIGLGKIANASKYENQENIPTMNTKRVNRT